MQFESGENVAEAFNCCHAEFNVVVQAGISQNADDMQIVDP